MVLELRCDQYSLCHYWKPAIFTSNLVIFHSNLRNIGRIAILNAGGERTAEITQATYCSCHDSIRTQNPNWSERTAKLVGTVIWNHGPVPTWPKNHGFMSGPGNNPAITKQVGIWPGLELNWTEPLAQIPTAGGFPESIANTTPETTRELYLSTRVFSFACTATVYFWSMRCVFSCHIWICDFR